MIITPLLQLAADKQASDLFFSVGAPINIKIEGVAMPVNAQNLDAETVKRIAYEMMSPEQIADVRPGTGDEFLIPARRTSAISASTFSASATRSPWSSATSGSTSRRCKT